MSIQLFIQNKIVLRTGFVLVWIVFVLSVMSESPLQEIVYVPVPEGSTLRDVSQTLKDHHVIRSSNYFSFIASVYGHADGLRAGIYKYEPGETVSTIIDRLVEGYYGIEELTVTYPEGVTISQMAVITEDVFGIPEEEFLQEAEGLEGYLFPDTYSFYVTTTANDIVDRLQETFYQKIDTLPLEDSPYTLSEIVTMASIVEKEASPSTREEIANILWKRIEDEMLLQVDAPFVYERQKGTFDLSIEDLEEDSLYNTYTREGLTPTPIGNPGLDSIAAAAFPEETPYYYFLTGRDGEMYYARTFAEHKQNKALYLR